MFANARGRCSAGKEEVQRLGPHTRAQRPQVSETAQIQTQWCLSQGL